MKAILFILILFINIFENVATGEDEDGGGPSQRKDKRPLEIIDLSSESNSPNTDREEHIGMNPESWPNAHFDSLTNTFGREFLPHQRGIKIGGEDGLANPSKKPKFSEPKMTYIDNSAKHIKVDDLMNFEHIVQQLTGKNADVKYISQEHGGIKNSTRLFPVWPLQQKFGTSMIGQNIGQSQQHSQSETVENRENTHYPIPLSFYDPQEGMVRTWHQFPQWRQEQREKQENLGQDFAGIILESSSANSLANFNFKETGKNALVNDNHEIIHQQNSLEIHKTQSSNSLNHYLQQQEKKLGEQIGARIGQGSSSSAFGVVGNHQQIQANMEENENVKPSKRGANYKEVRRFSSEQQFVQWIKSTDWTKCKYYQRKGYKCLARLKVIRPDSDIIIVEESDIQHYHLPIQPFVGQSRPMHP